MKTPALHQKQLRPRSSVLQSRNRTNSQQELGVAVMMVMTMMMVVPACSERRAGTNQQQEGGKD